MFGKRNYIRNIFSLGIFVGGVMVTLATFAQRAEVPFGKSEFDVEGAFVEGCIAMMKEDYEDATTIFNEILDEASDHHASRYQLAKIALQRQDYETAVEEVTLALNQAPDNYWYYVLLRDAQLERGSLARALTLQKEIVSRFPNKRVEQLQLVALYKQNGDSEEALEQINDISQSFGQGEDLLLEKYALQKEKGDLKAQEQTVKQLIELAPGVANYYSLLYDVYMRAEDEDAAMATLQQLLEQDPTNGYAIIALYEYHLQKGEEKLAANYLQQAFAHTDVKVSWKVETLTRLFEQKDKMQLASWPVDTLAMLLKDTHPGDPQTLNVIGEIYLANSEWDSANSAFRKALDFNPAAIDSWEKLLISSQAADKFDQMYQDAEEAIGFFPNNTTLLYYYGLAASRLEKWTQATYALEKVSKLPSTDEALQGKVLFEQASIAYRQNTYKVAEEFIEKALEITEDTHFLELKGDILYKTGEEQEAVKTWERAEKIGNREIDIESKLAQ